MAELVIRDCPRKVMEIIAITDQLASQAGYPPVMPEAL